LIFDFVCFGPSSYPRKDPLLKAVMGWVSVVKESHHSPNIFQQKSRSIEAAASQKAYRLF
jgi:hypothetical protein